MALNKNNESGPDLPKELAQPAIRALTSAGFTSLEQLSNAKAAELLKLHGMGPKAMGLLRGTLAARGLAFAEPDKR
jgi:hypothetical protein